ncbi:hypothetical protein B0H15DRAFT_548865 [Mycena belliarum]|uniref:Arrestin-like N-terminal domain-containing protein n=1 Tax=Mycena belliarum TaxID=1033014 RepID=A0AAD6XTZ2_9AGAR|nr:hypothetical protein B0H15DRAFT_548865 [Mycena belliae]
MAPNSDVHPPTFVLDFQDHSVRVAGDYVAGRVELNLARAQDEGVESLRVNLQGCMVTTIIEGNSDGADARHEQTVELIKSSKTLWDRGTAFPDPGSHVLDLPFQFKLPENLPPSFHICGCHHEAVIRYGIEVVGHRPGRLRKDRRIEKSLTVLPAASPAQVLAKRTLKQGWGGPWKTFFLDQKIRQGIWGDHSHVRIEVKMPKLESYPRATPLPVKFYIETRTKPMSRTDAPEDKSHRPLFPAPPTQSADVKLYFHRAASIRANRKYGTGNDSFQTRGGLGDPTSTKVKSTVDAAEWIPDPKKQDQGVWKRAVRFETKELLPYAPSFSTETIECKYFLRFTVSFPGIGNDLKLNVPIHLDPVHGRLSSTTYADVPPDDPYPFLDDCPPAYCT